MKNREMEIPQLQVGSSIMPGKVNPVIPEFVIGAVHKIYSNDQLISELCGLGCLELNAYIPVIGHALIESLKLLIACDNSLNANLVKGIQLNPAMAMNYMINSPSISTALVPYIGYDKATRLSAEMKRKKVNLLEANNTLGFMEEEKIKLIITPDILLREGYTLNDIIE
jgi:aspartate ammonia-lyase